MLQLIRFYVEHFCYDPSALASEMVSMLSEEFLDGGHPSISTRMSREACYACFSNFSCTKQ